MTDKILMTKKNEIYLLIFYFFCSITFQNILADYSELCAAASKFIVSICTLFIILSGSKIFRDKQEIDFFIIALVITGVIIRLDRVLNIPWNIYQHDVSECCGHWDYIYTIALKGKLPNSNFYQYYHPPLHHLIAVLWIKINSQFGVKRSLLPETVQYLTAFYSSLLMPIAYQIFKELGFNKKTITWSMALIALSPSLIIQAASMNNDTLSIVFVFLCVLYTIYWYKQPTLKNLILLAVFIGLGMMTKLSVVFITPCIAVIFVKALWIDRKIQLRKTWPQFMLFGIVSGVLGLWYPVRNYIKFEQPFNFVYEFKHSIPAYIEGYTVSEKLFHFPFISRLLQDPYCVNGLDYNLPIYVIKCATIGEYHHVGNEKILIIFEVVNMLLMICGIAAGIYIVFKVKQHELEKILFGLYWVIQVAAFILFYLKYPFSFTMHFRYIIPTVLIGTVFLGMFNEQQSHHKLWVRKIVLGTKGLIIVFCGLSIFTSFFII